MSVHPGPARKRGGRRPSVVRWRDPDTGRNRQRTFDTRAAAAAFDSELRMRAAMGGSQVAQLTGTGVTLGQWYLDRWEPEHAAVRLESATRHVYAEVWERHILPSLGYLPLTQIRPATLRHWQAGLVAGEVGPPTIRKARTVLSSVLRHAAESEAIQTNPLAVVRAPRRSRPKAVRPLQLAEVEAVRAQLLVRPSRRRPEMAVVDRRRDAAMVSLMALAGLRPGEVRGLQWGDVRDHTLVVERSVSRDGKVKAPKTAHIGTVRLLAPVVQDLTALREALPTGPGPDDWVIGELWDAADWIAWRRARWEPACRAADLDRIPRPYDLRHTFASGLLAEGRQVHDVATQMRHTPEMTLGTYGHLFDEVTGTAHIDLSAEVGRHRAAAEAATKPRDAQEGSTDG